MPRRGGIPGYRAVGTLVAALALVATFLGGTASAHQRGVDAAVAGQDRRPRRRWRTPSFPASNAVDGNTGTRWSSAFSDPQWLQVDLGATASITQVVLQWEAAYATAFQIQTSPDGVDLDDDLLHHHRHRRHADPERHRHRPVRPHVRHRPGHRRTATRCGSSRSTAPWAGGGDLRHRQRGAEPARHRLVAGERRRSRPPAPSTATPAPAGPARSATRSGCRSTWAPPRPSARSS